jgi:RNA polymerase sigma factor (TIGR02999 family)
MREFRWFSTMDPRVPRGAAPEPDEVTALLRAWSSGDAAAPDRLLPLVYRQLRHLAASQMRRERANHTLQPTALVHEAYLKLVDQRLSWKDRGHFYGVAARAMREVLVDHARKRSAGKRSPERRRISIEVAEVASDPRTVDLLALDEALEKLAGLDERQARLVELRLFAGLTVLESAEVLGCSSATASRDYRHAEAWLRRQMRGATA